MKAKPLVVLFFAFLFMFAFSLGFQAYVNQARSQALGSYDHWLREEYGVSSIEELRLKYEREAYEKVQASLRESDRLKQHLLSMQRLSSATGTNQDVDWQALLSRFDEEESFRREIATSLSSVTSPPRPEIPSEQPTFWIGGGDFNPFIELSVLSMVSMGFVGALLVPKFDKKLKGKRKLVFIFALIPVWVFFAGYHVGHVVAQSLSYEGTLGEDSLIKGASYVVWTDGTTVYAQNGTTGAIDYSGTDAATVIQSAINALTSGRAWKEKILLKGDFEVGAKLTIPSYTILETHGRLTLKDGVNDHIIEIDSKSHVDIIGGFLNGNKANQTSGHGIRVNASSYILIDAVHVENAYNSGIMLISCDDVRIVNPTTDGNGDDGIQMQGSNRVRVINPISINNDRNGIGIGATKCTDITLINPQCKDNGYAGISIDASSEVEVYGGESRSNGSVTARPGVFLSSAGFSLFVGHGSFGNAEHGYAIVNSPNVEIIGPRVELNNYHGIYGSGSDNIKVKGGLIKDNNQLPGTYDGIRVADSNYWVIESVVFKGTAHTYCIRSTGTATGQRIIRNDLRSYATAPVTLVGTNYLKGNIGYVTENSGTATDLANGGTLAHGLASTPTTVVLVPINATYGGELVLVYWDQANTDSTNISVDIYWANGTAITDSVIDVSWYAEV